MTPGLKASELVRPFHFSHGDSIVQIERCPPPLLRLDMVALALPVEDAGLVGPVAHRDTEVTVASQIDAKEPGHGVGQFHHVGSHGPVLVVVAGSPHAGKYYGVVGRFDSGVSH